MLCASLVCSFGTRCCSPGRGQQGHQAGEHVARRQSSAPDQGVQQASGFRRFVGHRFSLCTFVANAQICDFGYSKHEKYQSAPGSRVGTPAYLAPEVIMTTKGKTYDGKVGRGTHPPGVHFPVLTPRCCAGCRHLVLRGHAVRHAGRSIPV